MSRVHDARSSAVRPPRAERRVLSTPFASHTFAGQARQTVEGSRGDQAADSGQPETHSNTRHGACQLRPWWRSPPRSDVAAGPALQDVVAHEAAHFGGLPSPRPRRTAPWPGMASSDDERGVPAGREPRAMCRKAARSAPTMSRASSCTPVRFAASRDAAKRRVTNWRCPECRAIGLDGELL